MNVGLVGHACVSLLPNCEECGTPLLTLGSDGVSIIDRRAKGKCAECELPKRAWSAREWNRLKRKRVVVDPYGQSMKERVQ